MKQQIRQSVLSRHHRAQHQVDFYTVLSLKLSNDVLGLTPFFLPNQQLAAAGPDVSHGGALPDAGWTSA